MPNTTKPYKTHMQSQKRMSLYDKKTGSQMFQGAVSKQSRHTIARAIQMVSGHEQESRDCSAYVGIRLVC
jgi:hypothetical protein